MDIIASAGGPVGLPVNVRLTGRNFDQLKAIDSRFDKDIMDVFKFEVSIERKDATGNAAKVAVFNQLKKLAF